MDIDWNDLRLFLDVARLGGLSAATGTTRLSAATLGRRVTALEKQIGERLFVRQQTGYRLTPIGEELLRRAEDVEAAMQSLTRWREGNLPDRIVRVSAGPWTSAFVSAHIGEIWTVDDGIRVELVTTTDRVDIGRRAADMGIRSERPTEQWLAGRQSGKVAYAIYSGRRLINGIAAGLFVGVTGEAANIASARWLQAHHGDRIAVRGNNTHSVRDWWPPAPAFRSSRASSVTAIRGWFASLSLSLSWKPTNGLSPITRNVTRRRCEKSPTGLPP
ncbi:LysR family transcriptional regulator [Mesorhizobium sp.]|uniref:LysR family transcriptional regulator n=1 Tax=Mesorhizobium sp. TaxID=1871066 RepID=UPI001216E056|nr:LysR family transcriptional regulator [Mesorhizobium sp.]TIL40103.1 MAG: LysR family transcriptional regulator [Mesorhizobium sp.]